MSFEPVRKIVLDLEARRAPESIGSKYEENDVLPPHLHEIVTVSLADLWVEKEQNETVFNIQSLGSSKGPEKETLEAITNFLQKINFCMVTYNGHSYDQQVILHRCLLNGVSHPAWFQKGSRYESPTHRFSDRYHIDLCDSLSNYGASVKVSLSELAKGCGLPGKLGIDGSQIDSMYAAGRLEEIRNYCECDVALTTGLYLRFEHLRGNLTGQGFLLSARKFLNFLEENSKQRPHFREFLDHTNFDRFLNAGPSPTEEAGAAEALIERASKTKSNSTVKLKLVEDL